MKRAIYPAEIDALIKELRRLPGIGPRSAERIALWMVQHADSRAGQVANAINLAFERISPCARCGFFATGELCDICADPGRTVRAMCVVEQPTDILPLERTGLFRGRYHALGGRIAPLDHIGPEDLRIASLLERVRDEQPEEIILALSGDVEGEATAGYITEVLAGYPGTITRIAQGMPAGVSLESADEVTLGRALSGRTRVRQV